MVCSQSFTAVVSCIVPGVLLRATLGLHYRDGSATTPSFALSRNVVGIQLPVPSDASKKREFPVCSSTTALISLRSQSPICHAD